MSKTPYEWMPRMWAEAQREKRKFIKAVSDIEARALKSHNFSRADVCFIWLDELLIGIEVRTADGRGRGHSLRQVFYDEDLRTYPKATRRVAKIGRFSEAKRSDSGHKAEV